MRGNILYSIQVIVFTFILMTYLYFMFRKVYPKADKLECCGCATIMGILVCMVVTVLSMTYLESVYFNAWVLFWFINFSMAIFISRVEVNIVKFLQKKIDLVSVE